MTEGRVVATQGYRGRPRVQTISDEESLTVQSDKHMADINNIMLRYAGEGRDLLDEAALEFADISEFTDLADALNQAKLAEVEFMKLPSKVREIFNHDVANWLDTAHDDDKREALTNAGFLKPIVEVVTTTSGEGGTDVRPTPVAGPAEGDATGTP